MNDQELLLTTQSYESVAFQNSSEYLAGVIDNVSSMDGPLTPPVFATSREPIIEHGILPLAQNPGDARISPPEAAAMQVVADEGSAIAQSFGRMEIQDQLGEKIGGDNLWPSDVADGMADFGNALIEAARARELLRAGRSPVQNYGNAESEALTVFKAALELDGMSLKDNSLRSASERAKSLAEITVRSIPDGAEGSELQARIDSRNRGIDLAAKIYKDVYQIATQRGLDTNL